MAAALLLTFLLHTAFLTDFWFDFFAAVMASAWLGGKAPGWLAVILSTLAVDYVFTPPLHTLALHRRYKLFLPTIAVVSMLASWFNSWRNRTEASLKQVRDELEERAVEGFTDYAQPMLRIRRFTSSVC